MTIALRSRLILGPTLIVMTVIALALVVLVVQARQRIADERESSLQLAQHLAEAAIKSQSESTYHPALSLRQTLQDMPQLRHVRLFVLPLDDEALRGFKWQLQAQSGWLWRLLQPQWVENRIPISIYDASKGAVLIVADPSDEVTEIGEEFDVVLGLLLGLTAMFVGLVGWSVSKATQPLQQLQAGLERLQQGDYATALPPFRLPELTPIGQSFNHLAAMLAKTQRDNDLLIGKLISLQETERRDLARELHDELGPCLFGIKSEAACMGKVAADLTEVEVTARTGIIVKLVDDLQKMNRRILARLRPVALAELGLLAALERLVEDWQNRCPDIQWSLHCGHFKGEPSPDIGLALYRVVQECLTNAARHSGACMVSVELECGERTRLTIMDDGRGITDQATPGYGMMGMRERVQAVGGHMTVGNNPEGGTLIEVSL